VLAAYVGGAALFHAGARDAVRDAALRDGVTVVSAQALPMLPYVDLPSPERFAFVSTAVAFEMPSPVEKVVDRLRRQKQIPFPAGPFAWNGFVDDGSAYHRAVIEPLTGRVSWKQKALHGAEVPEVRALRGMQDVETYLWFARFPSAEVSCAGGRTEVTFFDLRFAGMPDTKPFVLHVTEVRGRSPASVGGASPPSPGGR
jgi:hypothetical protein